MNERPWFRPKRIGIGWTPATWEGWLVTLLIVAIFMGADLWVVAHLASHRR